MRNFKNERRNERFVRVNEQIRLSPVRVVRDGEQLGVMPTDQARKLAMEAGLDLVEIVPNVRPPVCSIVDYGKYKYEQSIREKEKKRKAKSVEMKEVKLTPKIAEHDIETKAKSTQRFLSEGKKVQLTMYLAGRMALHQEEGFKVFKKILSLVEGISRVEYGPKFEGRLIVCRLEPKG